MIQVDLLIIVQSLFWIWSSNDWSLSIGCRPSHSFYRGGKVQRLDRTTVWDGNSLELTSPTINIKIIHFVYFLLKNALLLLFAICIRNREIINNGQVCTNRVNFSLWTQYIPLQEPSLMFSKQETPTQPMDIAAPSFSAIRLSLAALNPVAPLCSLIMSFSLRLCPVKGCLMSFLIILSTHSWVTWKYPIIHRSESLVLIR